MSAAESFRYHRPFPFCPTGIDVDTLDFSEISTALLFVRDLTLSDACRLYWILERVELAFAANNIGFYSDEYGLEGLGEIDYSASLGTVIKLPRARVCGGGYIAGTWSTFALPDPAVSRVVWPHTYPDDEAAGQVAYAFGASAASGYLFPLEASGPVTRQPDGLYTFWFSLDQASGGDFIKLAGLGEDLGAGFNYASFATLGVPVLSGTLPLRVLVLAEPSYYHTSGGAVNTLTFTPHFFTPA